MSSKSPLSLRASAVPTVPVIPTAIPHVVQLSLPPARARYIFTQDAFAHLLSTAGTYAHPEALERGLWQLRLRNYHGGGADSTMPSAVEGLHLVCSFHPPAV